jgi:hypothetical protein
MIPAFEERATADKNIRHGIRFLRPRTKKLRATDRAPWGEEK